VTRATAVRRLVNMRSILIVMGLATTVYAQAPGESVAIAPLHTPARPQQPHPDSMPLDGGVIVGQIALGGLFELGGAVLGGYSVFRATCNGYCDVEDPGVVYAILGGGLLGGSLAMAGAIKLVGDDDKTEGSYLGATGGALLGGLAGFVAVAEIENHTHSESASAALDLSILGVSWLAGGMAGYYATRSWKHTDVKVTPLVAPQPHGGMTFGVAATF
jgi:hypothetical protein